MVDFLNVLSSTYSCFLILVDMYVLNTRSRIQLSRSSETCPRSFNLAKRSSTIFETKVFIILELYHMEIGRAGVNLENSGPNVHHLTCLRRASTKALLWRCESSSEFLPTLEVYGDRQVYCSQDDFANDVHRQIIRQFLHSKPCLPIGKLLQPHEHLRSLINDTSGES